MSVRPRSARSSRNASGIIGAIEKANDATLGTDETARRIRRYVAAHETPHDDRHAFSKLCEVLFAQGLGFEVVANHWPALEQAFAHFEPSALASLSEIDVGRLLAEPIIRNRAKVLACIGNARRWLELARTGSYLARVATLASEDNAAEGWPSLTVALRHDFHRLREPAARMLLKRWGFFTARSHPGAKRLLERLGLVKPDTAEALVQARIAQIGQATSTDPYAIEASLAIFAGAGPCRAKPRCDVCALNEACGFARHAVHDAETSLAGEPR
ncbi:MAG TPA: DNA-3-methyladenine glycosylase I [Candidatus Acidoferrales bacterium]|nr:DNA-3-methyladenine glycosylase I [Candidatus Acidoferrales bacterium]